jgi:hypothetical protein
MVNNKERTMKLKLMLTVVFGVFNVVIHGADLVLEKSELDEPEKEGIIAVTPPIEDGAVEDDRADSPGAIVRSKALHSLKPSNLNRLQSKPPQEASANPPLVGNLEIPMARTASGFTDDSEGVSTAGSPKITPKAADAEEANKKGFPNQETQ